MMVVPFWLVTCQRLSTQCGKRSLFPNMAKGPFRTEKRTVTMRHDGSKKRDLITDADRTLDTRSPWGGYKAHMDYESERNKRNFLLTCAIFLFGTYTAEFYMNRALVPKHSEEFELIRKRAGVQGSFPPDFETDEEKALWKH